MSILAVELDKSISIELLFSSGSVGCELRVGRTASDDSDADDSESSPSGADLLGCSAELDVCPSCAIVSGGRAPEADGATAVGDDTMPDGADPSGCNAKLDMCFIADVSVSTAAVVCLGGASSTVDDVAWSEVADVPGGCVEPDKCIEAAPVSATG